MTNKPIKNQRPQNTDAQKAGIVIDLQKRGASFHSVAKRWGRSPANIKDIANSSVGDDIPWGNPKELDNLSCVRITDGHRYALDEDRKAGMDVAEIERHYPFLNRDQIKRHFDKTSAIPSGMNQEILDVVIEPNASCNFYEDMTPLDIRNIIAYLSDRDSHMKGGESLWAEGAGLFIMNIHVILDALVKHEKARIAYCKENLGEVKIKYEEVIRQLNLALHNNDKTGVDVYMESSKALREKLELFDELAHAPRKWEWTLHHAITLKNHFTKVEETKDYSRFGRDVEEVLVFLGFCASEKRKELLPWTVYKGVEQGGTELQVAIDYFLKEFLAYDPNKKTSFTMNVNTAFFLFANEAERDFNAEKAISSAISCEIDSFENSLSDVSTAIEILLDACREAGLDIKPISE